MRSAHLALRDDRLKTGRTGVRWRPAWKWPAETERFVAEILAECPGPILHVCAGSSPLGDVKADMFHPAADVRADMYALPFLDQSFGTVVADPPFPLDGVTLPQRLAQFQEMGRVARPGGVVILHAPWLPSPTWADLEGFWFRETSGHAFPMAPVILSKWRVHQVSDPAKARDLEKARRGRPPAPEGGRGSCCAGMAQIGARAHSPSCKVAKGAGP